MRWRVVLLVVPGLVVAGCGSTSTTLDSFSVRPVLCYAPPYSGHGTPAGPLPSCASDARLTANNLGIEPNQNAVAGYATGPTVPPDPQFASYPSTPNGSDQPGAVVLLPGAPSAGTTNRFVLGPAALTAASVASASAQETAGQWIVNVVLTSSGATRWNALAQAQFHALVAVVLNGLVVTAPIIQPTQATFSSFSSRLQISGDTTGHQARAMAAELQP